MVIFLSKVVEVSFHLSKLDLGASYLHEECCISPVTGEIIISITILSNNTLQVL